MCHSDISDLFPCSFRIKKGNFKMFLIKYLMLSKYETDTYKISVCWNLLMGTKYDTDYRIVLYCLQIIFYRMISSCVYLKKNIPIRHVSRTFLHGKVLRDLLGPRTLSQFSRSLLPSYGEMWSFLFNFFRRLGWQNPVGIRGPKNIIQSVA